MSVKSDVNAKTTVGLCTQQQSDGAMCVISALWWFSFFLLSCLELLSRPSCTFCASRRDALCLWKPTRTLTGFVFVDTQLVPCQTRGQDPPWVRAEKWFTRYFPLVDAHVLLRRLRVLLSSCNGSLHG